MSGSPTISYRSDLDGISVAELQGDFFEGWPEPLTPQGHLQLLAGSDLVELAVDATNGEVVGFVTVLTDGRLSAFVSFLEVRSDHRGRGIGTTLMRRVLDRLAALDGGRGVNVDLGCNEELVPFYERFGMVPGRAMWFRRHLHARDAGAATDPPR